jgi:hypothetical protein
MFCFLPYNLINPVGVTLMSERKLRVFLCHASQDKPIVRELYQRLLVEGWIDPWLDKEKLLPGQDWELEIEKSVEDADVVIICLSKSSVEKEGYYQKEIKRVLDVADQKPEGTIFIIPLRLDDCQIPRRLTKWQYENYFPAGKREQAYARLLPSLSTRFSQVKSRNDDAQLINSGSSSSLEWDEKWLEKHRANAQNGMESNKFTGFVEVKFSLLNRKPNVSQKDLLSVARNAQIHTFGWPIGIVSDAPESSPKPQVEGIAAEVEFKIMQQDSLISSYDYWTLRNNGDFYLMKSLFEDSDGRWGSGTTIAFDTRIHRTTEILLYGQRLYEGLAVNPSAMIQVGIKHGGLKGRQLSATKATRRLFSRGHLVCIESETEKTIQVGLSDIKSNLLSVS